MPVRGHLVIRVEEASGKTQKGLFTWDTSSAGLEAFVKVELRGGAHTVKAQSSKAPLMGDTITWRENLKLDVLEGSNELRLMLCREKWTGAKKGTLIIAACGIFVGDIIDAVPIDKYFELFKPNGGGEGGLIRVCMDFSKDTAELEKPGHSPSLPVIEEPSPFLDPSASAPKAAPEKKKITTGSCAAAIARTINRCSHRRRAEKTEIATVGAVVFS